MAGCVLSLEIILDVYNISMHQYDAVGWISMTVVIAILLTLMII